MSGELNEKIVNFLWLFELVFDYDWDFSKNRINDEYFIKDDGTFLRPFPEEHFTGGKGDNWANRSSLIDAYRELKAFAISEGLIQIFDDDRPPTYLDNNGCQQDLY